MGRKAQRLCMLNIIPTSAKDLLTHSLVVKLLTEHQITWIKRESINLHNVTTLGLGSECDNGTSFRINGRTCIYIF